MPFPTLASTSETWHRDKVLTPRSCSRDQDMEMIKKAQKNSDPQMKDKMHLWETVRKMNGPLILRGFLMAVALIGGSGCAIFGSDDEPVKNFKVSVMAPKSPFEEVHGSGADHVWQSRKTGNTIAYNSACLEKNKEDLKSLEKGILEGVDNVQVVKESKVNVDGAPAERTLAYGKTDGIPISIDLVVVKKANCTYDLAYVARTLTFAQEQDVFDKFIERFHSP